MSPAPTRTTVTRTALRRAAALVMLLLVLAGVAPGNASAHTVSGVGATNFKTVLTGITPSVPGLTLRVIENGSRLELRNTTPAEVTVDGYVGEPYARVGPAGTYLNDNSPATYVNADRYGRTAVPAWVDAKATPKWRKISDAPLLRWHDHRIHWMLPTMPPAVARFPADFHRISTWTITLHYGGQQLSAAGELDWVPGPNPDGWLILIVLLVVWTGFGLPSLSHRWVAAALAVLIGVDVTHSTLIAAAAAGGFVAAFAADNVIQLGCWAVAAAGFFLLAQRKTSGVWVATGAAALIAVASGVTDMPTLWRSSAPLAGPLWLERLLVVATVGIGFGLVLALPLWLRAERFKAAQLPGEPAADELAATQPGERVSRRGVLTAGGLAGLGGLGAGAALTSGSSPTPRANPAPVPLGRTAVPFHGQHQAGIITPARPQARMWIAAFDLAPHTDRAALTALLRRWTDAAAQLTQGLPYGTDDLIAAGSGPASLTVTVGVGPSLFGKAGLPLPARPAALTPLPAFPGEHLDPARSDGDLGVLICADDALVVFHAAHTLQRLTGGTAVLRWQMSGFNRTPGAGTDDNATARNLMGQLDGTNNPKPADPAFTGHVFATGPTWMNGGSYLVIRRIRMLLDQWDTLPVTTQEQVIGRRKDNGAPLSGGTEFTPANYGQTSPSGHPTIPVHAHIRMSTPAFNNGATILRRGYSYTADNGDAGLLFMAWQADPRTGFTPIQRRLITGADALSPFIRHETSALFAMPAGTPPGGYLAQTLLES